MPVPYERITEHLLVNGESLVNVHAGDAHGSEMRTWAHKRGSETIAFWSGYLDSSKSEHLAELRKNEVVISIDPIYDRGYVATLPDGRRVNEAMATFSLSQKGVSLNNLGHVVFHSRETAVRLLRDEPYITNFEPQSPTRRLRP